MIIMYRKSILNKIWCKKYDDIIQLKILRDNLEINGQLIDEEDME